MKLTFESGLTHKYLSRSQEYLNELMIERQQLIRRKSPYKEEIVAAMDRYKMAIEDYYKAKSGYSDSAKIAMLILRNEAVIELRGATNKYRELLTQLSELEDKISGFDDD